MRGLKDKVIVIAGGAGPLGSATAARLTAEGAKVVVGDLDIDAARALVAKLATTGGEAVALPVDFREESSVAAFMAEAARAYGGFDALDVNGAISPEGDSDALSMPTSAFDAAVKVNLRGPLLCTKHALPELIKRGGGAIVYVGSNSVYMGRPDRISYSMAKSGLEALLHHVANQWGKQGVRANIVAPGLIATGGGTGEGLAQSWIDGVLKITPSPRLGAPDDIAAMVAFLASDDGAWINGQVIAVDGGRTQR